MEKIYTLHSIARLKSGKKCNLGSRTVCVYRSQRLKSKCFEFFCVLFCFSIFSVIMNHDEVYIFIIHTSYNVVKIYILWKSRTTRRKWGRKRKSFRIFDQQIFFMETWLYIEDLKLENRLKALANQEVLYPMISS